MALSTWLYQARVMPGLGWRANVGNRVMVMVMGTARDLHSKGSGQVNY